jgi:hypothetical protein
MASVTLAVLLVRLPSPSSIRTVIAGVIVAADAVFVGCCPNASVLAAPGVMLNEVLVAPVRDGLLEAVNVYPLPVLFIDKLAKVAKPLDAITALPPVSVPRPHWSQWRD